MHTADNTALPGALVTTSKGKKFTADANGIVIIDNHLNGKHIFTVSIDGNAALHYNAVIKRGTENRFVIKLDGSEV